MEGNIDTRRLPIKISLQKSRNYNWEINVAGTDVDEILAVLDTRADLLYDLDREERMNAELEDPPEGPQPW